MSWGGADDRWGRRSGAGTGGGKGGIGPGDGDDLAGSPMADDDPFDDPVMAAVRAALQAEGAAWTPRDAPTQVRDRMALRLRRRHREQMAALASVAAAATALVLFTHTSALPAQSRGGATALGPAATASGRPLTSDVGRPAARPSGDAPISAATGTAIGTGTSVTTGGTGPASSPTPSGGSTGSGRGVEVQITAGYPGGSGAPATTPTTATITYSTSPSSLPAGDTITVPAGSGVSLPGGGTVPPTTDEPPSTTTTSPTVPPADSVTVKQAQAGTQVPVTVGVTIKIDLRSCPGARWFPVVSSQPAVVRPLTTTSAVTSGAGEALLQAVAVGQAVLQMAADSTCATTARPFMITILVFK